jgi:hypothetical protein
MKAIKIDTVTASACEQGLTLIVQIQGKTIDLSGYVQKLWALEQGWLWCEEDLSSFAPKAEAASNLWRCPSIAILCLQLNRHYGDKIQIDEMTPARLESIQTKIIEVISNLWDSP